MVRLRVLSVLMMLIITITGCNLLKTEKDDLLINTLTELQHQIENEDWDNAVLTVDDLHKQYTARKWKLQFLGEKADYSKIELQIIALKETIHEKDMLEAKISLGQIAHLIHSIYRL
ncbi:MAG: DUF4363 family protein [Bacillota bacterium]|nr:DUF4363 family protein [Bacillota bacterium]MDW7684571.1 DUF4363 family protein [Bacillota bacterium]